MISQNDYFRIINPNNTLELDNIFNSTGKWAWDGDTWGGIGIGMVAGAAAGVGFYYAAPALAKTAVFSHFGASGTVAAYSVTGAATLGGAGYIAGFGGGMLYSNGNWSYSHQSGIFGAKIGAKIGATIGGTAGAVAGQIETFHVPDGTIEMQMPENVHSDEPFFRGTDKQAGELLTASSKSRGVEMGAYYVQGKGYYFDYEFSYIKLPTGTSVHDKKGYSLMATLDGQDIYKRSNTLSSAPTHSLDGKILQYKVGLENRSVQPSQMIHSHPRNSHMYMKDDEGFTGDYKFYIHRFNIAAIGAASYTVSVAFSDGGFSNWDWEYFGVAMLKGAITGVMASGIGSAFEGTKGVGNALFRGIVHGHTQATFSAITGGDYATTFVTSAVTSVIGSATYKLQEESLVGYLMFNSTVGGATQAIQGGNFWEGFTTGAMITVLNHSGHILKALGRDKKIKLSEETQKMKTIKKVMKAINTDEIKPEYLSEIFEYEKDQPGDGFGKSYYKTTLRKGESTIDVEITLIFNKNVKMDLSYEEFTQPLDGPEETGKYSFRYQKILHPRWAHIYNAFNQGDNGKVHGATSYSRYLRINFYSYDKTYLIDYVQRFNDSIH